MSFFENYVSVYTSGTPKGFDTIAPQLREGISPLQIRNQLMGEQGLSRMAAGKMVEGTEKYAKAAKANMITGAGLLVFGFAIFMFVSITSLLAYFAMFIGAAQLVAGVRGQRVFKQAGANQQVRTKGAV